MTKEDSKYFSEFLEEFQNETDRGAALIDSRLKRLLLSHFADKKVGEKLLEGRIAPLGSFSSRIKTAYCLALITKFELNESKFTRKIRNEFAHQEHGLTFNDSPVKNFASQKKSNTSDGNCFDEDPRQLYINSVIMVSLAFWYRPEYAKEYKAEIRNWDWQVAPD